MARKSRKESIQAVLEGKPVPVADANTPQTVVWNTGGYARLSIMETRDRKDSEALSNQKALLRSYIDTKPELRFCEIYADNGETGTNFDRSAFQRLMADVRAGKINCIVVKDLSRFGRNCVEAGDYLERVFPFLGVRFISIGDNYDSFAANSSDTLAVALKNLVNEVYSMDISRKSGSVLREKQRRGEFIGAFAAYGYLRDPTDIHRMIVDPEAAAVVREVFRRVAEGTGVRTVLRWLNTTGVLTPCAYRYQKGICLDKRYANGRTRPWGQETLKNILSNPVYLGHTVQGRRRSEFYAGIPDRRLPQSEWIIVKNTHEPIIDQDTFDRVQALRQASQEKYHANLGKYDHLGSEENIFRGLIFCGDCGRPMVRYKEVIYKKRVVYRYICSNYADLLGKSGCSYKFLPLEDLNSTLSQLIAQEAMLAADASVLLRKREKKTISLTSLELTRAKAEQNNLTVLRERLMRDFLSGILSKDDHDRMKKKYEQEGQALDKRITLLQKEQRKEDELLSVRNPWLAVFKNHTGKVELTKALVQSLVERITVYEKNRVEIQLKYRDERAILLEALKGSAKEVGA